VSDATVTLVVGLLATPIAVIFTFLFGRKKTVAETTEAIAQGANSAVEAISVVLDNLREELESTKNQLNIALLEIEKLRIQNEQLLKENKDLSAKISVLTERIEQMNSKK